MDPKKPILKRWSPEISPVKIKRVYESDAKGLLDENLINEVGFLLYARCSDIIEVTNARDGNVKCQNCSRIVKRTGGINEIIACTNCGWSIIWRDYKKTYNRKGLLAGVKGAKTIKIFNNHVSKWVKSKKYNDKMAIIDYLIHEFHESIKEGSDTRPVACNVIQDNAHEVIQLINDLAYGEKSCIDSKTTLSKWEKRLEKTSFAGFKKRLSSPKKAQSRKKL